jgi:D-alanine-D-alanine ligase
MSRSPSVLVLGGGPDAERDVSLRSAAAVADALREAGFTVEARTIDAILAADLEAMKGDVIFPVLHGPFGEGGPMQDLLEASGRRYVGCGPSAARLAMDKIATKLAAARAGVPTAPAQTIPPAAARLAIDAPLVIKPVHEGSSVGLSICRTHDDVIAALVRCEPGRVWMAEALLNGRELTVGLVPSVAGGLEALPIVEIRPASGVYDYEAKYVRGDTVYVVTPDLPEGVAETLARDARRAAEAVGVRHIARVDFILTDDGIGNLLEINTMPGFTATSLLPKAARAAGIDLPALCARLVRAAFSGE